MTKSSVLLGGGMALLLAACQPPPSSSGSGASGGEVEKKLDEINTKLDEISTKIDKVGAGAGKRPKRPPGPDPKAVYSVALGDSPYKGAEHAKVTIVEAFEFA